MSQTGTFANLPQLVKQGNIANLKDFQSANPLGPKNGVKDKFKVEDLTNSGQQKELLLKSDFLKKNLNKTSSVGGTGVDGGGGNALLDGPIDEADIQRVTKDYLTSSAIRLILNYASSARDGYLFDRHEPNATPEQKRIFELANTKLFYGQKTIFDIIGKPKINFQNDPCFEKGSTEEKDGSADPESNSICLSTGRLLKRLNTSNYEQSIVILMIHEYLHFFLNEPEIKVIESRLQELISSNPLVSAYKLNSEESGYGGRFIYALQSIEGYIKNNVNDPEQLCGIVYQAIQKKHGLDALWAYYFPERGMDFWTARDQEKLDVVDFRLYNLAQTCRLVSNNPIVTLLETDPDDAERFKWLKIIFPLATERYDLSDKKIRESLGIYGDEQLTGSLFKVSTGNAEYIQIEANELIKFMHELEDRTRSLFK
jgi:hypothetical protein